MSLEREGSHRVRPCGHKQMFSSVCDGEAVEGL